MTDAKRERERERRLPSRLLRLGVVTLCLLLVGSCGDMGSLTRGSSSDDAGGLPGGGIRPEGGLGGGGPVDPYPLFPQDMRDLYGQDIGPWGPVTRTHSVTVGEEQYLVNQLSSSDPFLALYQLPDGTLVASNEPLENIVTGYYALAPPVIEWIAPTAGPLDIFEGEIIVDFIASATQLDIEQFIAAHSLDVIMSFFRALPPPAVGNEIANFRFFYDEQEFPTFNDAYAFLNGHALVQKATPNLARALEKHYAQGPPVDEFYLSNETEYVDALQIDASALVDMGPPFAGELSRQVVAVMDDGVYRFHPDFGNDTANRKLADVGVDSWHYGVAVKAGGGHPVDWEPGRQGLVSHGTACAGLITAWTTPEGVLWDQGVPGVAPRVCVLPIRLELRWDEEDQTFYIVESSIYDAIRAMIIYFRHGIWRDGEGQAVKLRVVSMSFGTPDRTLFFFHMNEYISLDLTQTDRLYVSSAGNDAAPFALYFPAGYDNVLGVSGVWVTPDGDVSTTPYEDYWFARIPETRPGYEYPWRGSNWRVDPNDYPVSGIYGFCGLDESGEPDGSVRRIVRSLSPPAANSPYGEGGLYDHFWATSAAVPQVAGLAALLYDRRDSEVDYEDVWNRIVSTRNLGIEQAMEVSMAGVVMYDAALTGWGD